MTLGDAMAKQTAWLNVWLPILMFGSFILPLALGLPHVLFYTPVVIYFISRLRGGELPKIARWLMMASLVIILISLAFDYTDVARYILGNRTPLAVPDGFAG